MESVIEENGKQWNNDKLLTAWGEWKEICSILGCGDEAKNLLLMEIGKAFRRKLGATVGEIAYEHLYDADADEMFAREFDCGITEKAFIEKKKKNYKDYVWSKIAACKDEPLKVIRGILTGPRGYINNIVENWLRSEGWRMKSVTDKVTGKRHDIWLNSTGLPANASSDDTDEDVSTLTDETPDLTTDVEIDVYLNDANRSFSGVAGNPIGLDISIDRRGLAATDSKEEENDAAEEKSFVEGKKSVFEEEWSERHWDRSDAAILVAWVSSVSITTDEKLLAFTGLGKSAISKRWNGYKNKLLARMSDANNVLVMKAWLDAARIELEKTPEGQAFLVYTDECAIIGNSNAHTPLSRPMVGFEDNDFYSRRQEAVEKRANRS